MKPADIKRVAAAALSSFDIVMSELGLDGGRRQGPEYLPLNPRRADAKPGSFCINCDSGAWSDFATGDKGGDLVSLAAYLWEEKQTDAAKRLGKLLGIALPDAPQSPASASAGSGKAKASPATPKPASAPPSVCVMRCPQAPFGALPAR